MTTKAEMVISNQQVLRKGFKSFQVQVFHAKRDLVVSLAKFSSTCPGQVDKDTTRSLFAETLATGSFQQSRGSFTDDKFP